jgi:hypothetical protein
MREIQIAAKIKMIEFVKKIDENHPALFTLIAELESLTLAI